LMADSEKYEMFKLVNKEFTVTVDVSTLPCGLNGALYFVEMPEDGGSSKYPTNEAGAKYGTGYCDAQCPHDIKYQNGQANTEDFKKGMGKWGSCCAELDIWEANKISNAFTTHPCNIPSGHVRCDNPQQCGDNASKDRYAGLCDKDGCDMNTYRAGQKNFFGPGSQFQINSNEKFTVVTQFISTDGTDNGDLKEMKRVYVQNGKVVKSPESDLSGMSK